MPVTPEVIPDRTIPVLDHGFVRLDESMASDLSVANAARVSFARRKEEMDESDAGLIRFLMRDRHGTPFEHNAFRFHIRTPIFVAREWFRHRIGCLTEDALVTFINGEGSVAYRKTMGELWEMWSSGERNPHALQPETAAEIHRLRSRGRSMRSIAAELGIGRRSVRSELDGRNSYRDARWRVRRMRLRVLNEDSAKFQAGHISDVVDKGIQPVYCLTLADGKQLTLTEEHQLLTPEGWRTMREATGLSGHGDHAIATRECSLMTNGVPAHQSYDWLKSRREQGRSVAEMAEEAGCSYHTVRKWLAVHDLRFTREERYRSRPPWNEGLRGYRTRLVVTDRHREAIRRARSGAQSNFWRGGVSSRRASIGRWTTEQAPKLHLQFDYTCQACHARGGKLHAHHIVPVWFDPERALEIGNLVSVCDTCHRGIHATRESELAFMETLAPQIGVAKEVGDFQRKGWKLTAQPVRVVAIRYVGLRQTYDLCVGGPWHNFVANGVVVHNSFNEFSMRYAKATDEFYVPAPDDVRTQVGKPGSYSFEQVSPEVADTTREELRAVYDAAYAAYERLVELGVARELARCAIPVGAYTEFYWTVNARALMNFLSLRAAETAQREIRYYAEACERFFAEAMPVTYEAFVAAGRVAP